MWLLKLKEHKKTSLDLNYQKERLINEISSLLASYRQKLSSSRYERVREDSLDSVEYQARLNKIAVCYACLQYLQRDDDPNFLKTIIMLMDEKSDENFISSGISSRCQAIVKRTLRFIGEERKLSLGLNSINPDCDELQDKQTSPIPYAREIQHAVQYVDEGYQIHSADCHYANGVDIPVAKYSP